MHQSLPPLALSHVSLGLLGVAGRRAGTSPMYLVPSKTGTAAARNAGLLIPDSVLGTARPVQCALLDDPY